MSRENSAKLVQPFREGIKIPTGVFDSSIVYPLKNKPVNIRTLKTVFTSIADRIDDCVDEFRESEFQAIFPQIDDLNYYIDFLQQYADLLRTAMPTKMTYRFQNSNGVSQATVIPHIELSGECYDGQSFQPNLDYNDSEILELLREGSKSRNKFHQITDTLGNIFGNKSEPEVQVDVTPSGVDRNAIVYHQRNGAIYATNYFTPTDFESLEIKLRHSEYFPTVVDTIHMIMPQKITKLAEKRRDAIQKVIPLVAADTIASLESQTRPLLEAQKCALIGREETQLPGPRTREILRSFDEKLLLIDDIERRTTQQ